MNYFKLLLILYFNILVKPDNDNDNDNDIIQYLYGNNNEHETDDTDEIEIYEIPYEDTNYNLERCYYL